MANTIGMTAVARFNVATAPPYVTMTSTFCGRISGRKLDYALRTSLRPVILEHDSATVDPAKFTEPLHKSGSPQPPSKIRQRQGMRWLAGRQAAAHAQQAAEGPLRRQ